jgi:uncharacterized protein YfaS (alpha-2-macroglobulin family)
MVFLLSHIQITAIIFIVVCIIVLLYLLYRKIVGTLTLGVATNKQLYVRGETVSINGSLKVGTVGVAGETVSMAVSPPSGDAYSLPNAVTDASGNFSATWIVASDTVDGLHTLTVSAKGLSKTSTFTRLQQVYGI